MNRVAFAKGTWPKRPLAKMQLEWPNIAFAKHTVSHFFVSKAFVFIFW
jgi:hypothetical protein